MHMRIYVLPINLTVLSLLRLKNFTGFNSQSMFESVLIIIITALPFNLPNIQFCMHFKYFVSIEHMIRHFFFFTNSDIR